VLDVLVPSLRPIISGYLLPAEFSAVWAYIPIVLRAGQEAASPFPVDHHMLRHACGFYLANKGAGTRGR